jgi:hypothetical protein
MSDYKTTTLTGNSWQRCYQISIENSLDVPPTIRFDEERIFRTEFDGDLHKPLGTFSLTPEMADDIDILNPINGAPIGKTITYGEIYALIYSVYISAAKARDMQMLSKILSEES